jgi:serine/threonine protein kinase
VAALNHSGICTLHDVGPNYLVMEYIEGTPLEGPLPVAQALKYAVQVCEALDAAHQKGITHRDLKPANILATRSGIKLLDFGLAKLAVGGAGRRAPRPATPRSAWRSPALFPARRRVAAGGGGAAPSPRPDPVRDAARRDRAVPRDHHGDEQGPLDPVARWHDDAAAGHAVQRRRSPVLPRRVGLGARVGRVHDRRMGTAGGGPMPHAPQSPASLLAPRDVRRTSPTSTPSADSR